MTLIVKNENTGLGALTPENIKTLEGAGIIPPNTPPAQIKVFAQICKEKGLSPFSKEIYLVSYFDKNSQSYKYSPITGINGYRKIADRTGFLAGCSIEKYNLKSDGTHKTASDLKSENKLPETCTVTVFKIVGGMKCDFTHTAVFSEFNTGKNKWKTMPFQMINKVAEAFAIRKAFGSETSGISLREEMGAFEDSQMVPEMTEEDAQELESVYKEIDEKLPTLETLKEIKEFFDTDSNWNYDESIVEKFKKRKDEIYNEIKEYVEMINDIDGLKKYWEEHPEWRGNKTIEYFFASRKNQLTEK